MADGELYAVLGVSRSASAEEIKRAYRQLARHLHPDRNQGDPTAETRFKQVSYAYGILSDARKRRLYDRYGEEGLREGFHETDDAPPRSADGRARVDFEDLFGRKEPQAGSAAGGFRMDDFLGGFGRGPASRRGSDLHCTAVVDLPEAVRGCVREIRVRGTDGSPGTRVLRVRIPPGVRNGERVRVRGLGRPGTRGGASGDLWLVVRVRPHPWFFLEGGELHAHVPLSPLEAYEGALVRMPTPHGSVHVRVPAGTPSGARLRVRAHGIQRGAGPPGDLILHLHVRLPTDSGLREAYERLDAALGGDLRRELRFD